MGQIRNLYRPPPTPYPVGSSVFGFIPNLEEMSSEAELDQQVSVII